MAEEASSNGTKLAIAGVNAAIMDNKALLHQSRAHIEENRLMILSNYAAALSGNQQLANHTTEEIFASRKTILETFDCEEQVQREYVEAAQNRSDLDLLLHGEALNEQIMAANEKMVQVNRLLIAVNQTIMALNQEILDFNEENLESNNELMSGVLNPMLVEADTVHELVVENAASLTELQGLAAKNRQQIAELLIETSTNAEVAISDKREITARKKSLYANREEVSAMREVIGKEVGLADIFLADAEE